MASLLAVVTAVLAQVSFRVGPVPYTMQNTGVILSGLLLPPRWALASELLYLLMIALGAPVAAGFRGGVSVFLGPTGGYLAGFPIAAFLMGLLREWCQKLLVSILRGWVQRI
jgi:biotin transport system substrate-specific component